VLREAEWKSEEAHQAAADLYELMVDAESSSAQKLYILRAIRSYAADITLKLYRPRNGHW